MLLLDRIVGHAEGETVCALLAGRSFLFERPDGAIPGFVALEWMAQCVAAHGGLLARERGDPPRPGLFLGSRRARLPDRPLAPDRTLHVGARMLRGRGVGAHAFACRLFDPADGQQLAQATLQVMIFESLEALRAAEKGARGATSWL